MPATVVNNSIIVFDEGPVLHTRVCCKGAQVNGSNLCGKQ